MCVCCGDGNMPQKGALVWWVDWHIARADPSFEISYAYFVSGPWKSMLKEGGGLRSDKNRILVGNTCSKKFNKTSFSFFGDGKWKWREAEVNHRTKGSVIHDMSKIPQNFTGTRITETYFLHDAGLWWDKSFYRENVRMMICKNHLSFKSIMKILRDSNVLMNWIFKIMKRKYDLGLMFFF